MTEKSGLIMDGLLRLVVVLIFTRGQVGGMRSELVTCSYVNVWRRRWIFIRARCSLRAVVIERAAYPIVLTLPLNPSKGTTDGIESMLVE